MHLAVWNIHASSCAPEAHAIGLTSSVAAQEPLILAGGPDFIYPSQPDLTQVQVTPRVKCQVDLFIYE